MNLVVKDRLSYKAEIMTNMKPLWYSGKSVSYRKVEGTMEEYRCVPIQTEEEVEGGKEYSKKAS